jgi:Polysaccharide pyruvyl transferase
MTPPDGPAGVLARARGRRRGGAAADPPSGRRPLVYLVATAGFPNFGDELIARAWLRYLAERAPEADVWLDCPFPGSAQALLADAHPRLRCTDTLFRVCWEAPDDEPWSAAAHVAAAVATHGVAPRWIPGLRVLEAADSLHVLGGGWVNELWPRHVGVLSGVVATARRTGARTAVTGQGLLPLSESGRQVVAALLADVGTVDVRDRGSLAAAGPAAGLSGDDAWLADPAEVLWQDGPFAGSDVVVCVQADLGEGSPGTLAAQVLAQLRHWDADPARVSVVECIPPGDRGVFTLLEPVLPGLRFVPFVDVWAHGLPVAPQQRWVSTRFHPHLLAASAGAWGVAVDIRPGYYDHKHGSLVDAGSDWAVAQPGAAPLDAPPRWSGLSDAAPQLRRGKRELADSIYCWL